MTALVFVGPTLAADDLESFGQFRFLPPVAQGDVYRACRERPAAIGIVDGYFDGVPSVWHKEILWAMAQGIHVFGAASMGALRAAELHAFGMRGYGSIFRAFRDGTLTDDDEVAIRHGPSEAGYATVSLPMANVRATLAKASSGGILDETSRLNIERAAKAQYYAERTWSSVIEAARGRVESPLLKRLESWIAAGGEVNQKRADALELLAAMDAFLAEDPEPMSVNYPFQETQLWAFAEWKNSASPPVGPPATQDGAILDELRLDPANFERVRRLALCKRLALEDLGPGSLTVDWSDVSRRVGRFRRERGLLRAPDLAEWLDGNDMNADDLERMIADETLLAMLELASASELGSAMLDQIRLEGRYETLAERAEEKARIQRQAGFPDTSPETIGVSPLFVDCWYFEQNRGTGIPDDLDGYARSLGLSGRVDLRRLLGAEYLVQSGRESARVHEGPSHERAGRSGPDGPN